MQSDNLIFEDQIRNAFSIVKKRISINGIIKEINTTYNTSLINSSMELDYSGLSFFNSFIESYSHDFPDIQFDILKINRTPESSVYVDYYQKRFTKSMSVYVYYSLENSIIRSNSDLLDAKLSLLQGIESDDIVAQNNTYNQYMFAFQRFIRILSIYFSNNKFTE